MDTESILTTNRPSLPPETHPLEIPIVRARPAVSTARVFKSNELGQRLHNLPTIHENLVLDAQSRSSHYGETKLGWQFSSSINKSKDCARKRLCLGRRFPQLYYLDPSYQSYAPHPRSNDSDTLPNLKAFIMSIRSPTPPKIYGWPGHRLCLGQGDRQRRNK